MPARLDEGTRRRALEILAVYGGLKAVEFAALMWPNRVKADIAAPKSREAFQAGRILHELQALGLAWRKRGRWVIAERGIHSLRTDD